MSSTNGTDATGWERVRPGMPRYVVAGDSLLEWGARDGDRLVVDPAGEAPDGELAVFVYADGRLGVAGELGPLRMQQEDGSMRQMGWCLRYGPDGAMAFRTPGNGAPRPVVAIVRELRPR